MQLLSSAAIINKVSVDNWDLITPNQSPSCQQNSKTQQSHYRTQLRTIWPTGSLHDFRSGLSKQQLPALAIWSIQGTDL